MGARAPAQARAARRNATAHRYTNGAATNHHLDLDHVSRLFCHHNYHHIFDEIQHQQLEQIDPYCCCCSSTIIEGHRDTIGLLQRQFQRQHLLRYRDHIKQLAPVLCVAGGATSSAAIIIIIIIAKQAQTAASFR